jgi:HD-GYP domain-containing protein (c-di-GMP phosphodiesterase class II)
MHRLAKAVAQIVDAKTPYTYAHSIPVTDIALGVAEVLDFPPPRRRLLWTSLDA